MEKPCFLFLDIFQAFEEWEQQYMLILWLSIAVQVPFDLKKLTDPDDLGTERSIEHRIFRVCQVSFATCGIFNQSSQSEASTVDLCLEFYHCVGKNS